MAEPHPPSDAAALATKVPKPGETSDGLANPAEDYSEQVVDAIEMLGEETAAGFRPPGHSEVTAGMRYLHSSRTINQLVTDRNRAVGIYLAVASLLFTASSALVNANPRGDIIVPIEKIQRWCLPITFFTMTVMALFVAFLLIRTRVGLIYEVAKMNALLGLPIGRVQRVNVMGIFFIMHAIVSLGGGCSGAIFSIFMMHLANPEINAAWPALFIGIAITTLLIVLYVVTVRHITSDERLKKIEK